MTRDELVRDLREVSAEKQQEAWSRLDGGQDLSIGAMLADAAADRIEADGKLIAEMREALGACFALSDEWANRKTAILARLDAEDAR
jgi:hypothetical protein